MKWNPFQVYVLFHCLKLHFNSPRYDIFKSKGKVRLTEESFEKRKDKKIYFVVSRKVDKKEMMHFLLSNIVYGNTWIGDIAENGVSVYGNWKDRVQKLTYLFTTELEELLEESDLDSLFSLSSFLPPIIRKYMANKVSLEFLCILEEIYPFTHSFDSSDFVLQDIRKRIKKYTPFLEIDINKFENTFKKVLTNSKN